MSYSSLRRGEPLRRKPMRRRTPDGGRDVEFSDEVKANVRRRSGNRCEVKATKRCAGRIEVFHHVRRRSQGGKGDEGNCLGSCNDCHEHIHAHPEESYLRGWLVRGSGLALR